MLLWLFLFWFAIIVGVVLSIFLSCRWRIRDLLFGFRVLLISLIVFDAKCGIGSSGLVSFIGRIVSVVFGGASFRGWKLSIGVSYGLGICVFEVKVCFCGLFRVCKSGWGCWLFRGMIMFLWVLFRLALLLYKTWRRGNLSWLRSIWGRLRPRRRSMPGRGWLFMIERRWRLIVVFLRRVKL